jgi:hypothetical protein
MVITADVFGDAGANITLSVSIGSGTTLRSTAITSNVSDATVVFPGDGLRPLVGTSAVFQIEVTNGVVYTLGFIDAV